MRRELAKVRAVAGDQPQIGPPAVGLQVRRAHDERDPLPIGRCLRIGDAVHREHVMDGEWVRRLCACHRHRQRQNDD